MYLKIHWGTSQQWQLMECGVFVWIHKIPNGLVLVTQGKTENNKNRWKNNNGTWQVEKLQEWCNENMMNFFFWGLSREWKIKRDTYEERWQNQAKGNVIDCHATHIYNHAKKFSMLLILLSDHLFLFHLFTVHWAHLNSLQCPIQVLYALSKSSQLYENQFKFHYSLFKCKDFIKQGHLRK